MSHQKATTDVYCRNKSSDATQHGNQPASCDRIQMRIQFIFLIFWYIQLPFLSPLPFLGFLCSTWLCHQYKSANCSQSGDSVGNAHQWRVQCRRYAPHAAHFQRQWKFEHASSKRAFSSLFRPYPFFIHMLFWYKSLHM